MLSRRRLTLALAMTPGIGGRSITRILTRNDLVNRSPESFVKLPEVSVREEYRLPVRACSNWDRLKAAVLNEAAVLEEKLDRLGIGMVTAADAHYPALLEEMDPDPPGVIFLYGNTKLLEAPTFAVLASRNAAPAILDHIERLTEEGVMRGEVLVAGHDTPEYQRAAVVPLRWGAPRILVLDRGFFLSLGEDLSQEPFRAARLWRYQFDERTDLVVSAVRPESEYHRNSNRIRDRMVAGLARSIDFALIRQGGNMEQLARRAIHARRKVRISDISECYREFRELGVGILQA